MASAIDAGRDMIVCGLRSVRIYVFPLQRDRVMELHSALSLFIIYIYIYIIYNIIRYGTV